MFAIVPIGIRCTVSVYVITCLCNHKSVTGNAYYLCIGTLGRFREDSDLQVKGIAMTAEEEGDLNQLQVERTITVGFADEETETAE